MDLHGHDHGVRHVGGLYRLLVEASWTLKVTITALYSSMLVPLMVCFLWVDSIISPPLTWWVVSNIFKVNSDSK